VRRTWCPSRRCAPSRPPAFLERRLQSIGWSPRFLHFFQLLLAELGVARRRGSGGSVGVVLLVLVLGEGPAYFRPLLAILDAGEDVEVLELLAIGVVAVHVERPAHLHREADIITNRRSNVDGEKRVPWSRSRRR
jgi:hypothetical protein